MSTALIFSRDPGGTNQMIGVAAALAGALPEVAGDPGLAALNQRLGTMADRAVTILAKDFAQAVWKGADRPAEPWPLPAELSEADRHAAMRALLRDRRVGAVLSATSDYDDDTDVALWRAARAEGIPCHVFVDGEYNLLARFKGRDGQLFVPDHLYVPSLGCQRPLVEGGLPESIFTLVPDLAVIVRARRQDEVRRRAPARRQSWGAGSDDTVLLFASENVEEMVGTGKPLIYSEHECLQRVLDAVAGKTPIDGIPSGPAVLVVVRPHPKERPGKFDRYLSAGHRMLVSRDGDAEEAILAADLAVGMNSTLLREALALGKPAISLVGAQMVLDGSP